MNTNLLLFWPTFNFSTFSTTFVVELNLFMCHTCRQWSRLRSWTSTSKFNLIQCLHLRHMNRFNSTTNMLKKVNCPQSHSSVTQGVGGHLHLLAWPSSELETQLSYMGGRPHLSHILPLPFRRLGRYQITLLGDRGTRVWTTCPGLLPGSGTAGSRTCDLAITSPTR